ncbi:hypothetical protein CPB84DRAFT_1895273, partial [Gymnopilus junonius]
SQRSKVLEAFEEAMPRFLDIILEHEFNALLGQPCPFCNSSGTKRTMQCYDCAHPLSCSECFISAHQHNRTHWAEVWNSERQYFVRHDISTLRPEGYAQHLGHNGDPCPMPENETDLFFIIVDVNGIHNTKLRFCHCPGAGDRVDQLLHHCLFPATLGHPESAFTFQLLHNFHLHHLESKATKYDYMGALRRLTDNAFTSEVLDLYPQFQVVTQVWMVLTAKKRLGQAHGIDEVLPHRPSGSLVVSCPACPDPHMNMLSGWEKTPSDFRHLNQLQLTLDGNFHLNCYVKNTDPHDTSLFHGRSYFPDDSMYADYVRKVVLKGSSDKFNCGHLEVLRKQNSSKKFKNMAVTGKVNTQCSHVFILSSVDLQISERFANVNFGLAHALRPLMDSIRKHKIFAGWSEEKIQELLRQAFDVLISYDVTCSYCVHVLERFINTTQIQDVAQIIAIARWLIPLVHVQNHNDDCMYRFASAYIKSAGHFHGETAEHFWPTGNQLGGQTCQMNAGHCHDTLIDHFGNWNFKKLINLHESDALYNDLINAKKLYDVKLEIFKGLSSQYVDYMQEWDKLDRSWSLRHGAVYSVYRHNQKKVPSQMQIYEMLLKELESESSESHLLNQSSASKSDIHFIHEGLLIRAAQLEIRTKIAFSKTENSEALKATIENAHERLRTRIDKWCSKQKCVLPQVADLVAAQVQVALRPEDECLFLPSDLSEKERQDLDIPVRLTICEHWLLEGHVYDVLRDIRTIVKTLTNLCDEKKAQDYGQVRQTRSSTRIQEVVALRDGNIKEYNSACNSLINLGCIDNDDPILRPLKKEDTYHKRTTIKRAVGDTYRHDGLMWTNRGLTAGTQRAQSTHASAADAIPSEISTLGTQGSKPKKHLYPFTYHSLSLSDGWIWTIRPCKGLKEEELRDWLEEGDRVQWFRAEAEMQRWREEWEIKQAEFLHCIHYFDRLSNAWSELASLHSGGKASYAKKTAAMYRETGNRAKNLLIDAGYGHLLELDGPALVSHFQELWSLPDNNVPELQVRSFTPCKCHVNEILL